MGYAIMGYAMKTIRKYLLAYFASLIVLNLSASEVLTTAKTKQKPLIGGISLKKNNQLIKNFPQPSSWLMSTSCSACHGTYGAEFNDIIPPIAGMSKKKFIDKMQEYKKRPPNDFVVMGIIAQPLSDKEIADMADFFSQQQAVEWTRSDWNKDVKPPRWLQKEQKK